MTINLNTGGKKRFNLVLLGVLAVCFQDTGKAYSQGLGYWHEAGTNHGIQYDIRHSVFVSNTEDVEWPVEPNNYTPANPPLTPVGDTPVSRQKVTATNTNSVKIKVILRVVCLVQQNTGDAYVEVSDSSESRTLKPNETATWDFDFNEYTPPAMPNAPQSIRYDLRLEREDPFMPNIVRRTPPKALNRHH